MTLFFFQGQISFDVTDGVGSRWADKEFSLIPSSLDHCLKFKIDFFSFQGKHLEGIGIFEPFIFLAFRWLEEYSS